MHSLGWIARQLRKQHQIEFVIEKIQLDYLETEVSKKHYRRFGKKIRRISHGWIDIPDDIKPVERFQIPNLARLKELVTINTEEKLESVEFPSSRIELYLLPLVSGVTIGIIDAFNQELSIRSHPNQGIKNSFVNMFYLSIVSIVIIFTLTFLVISIGRIIQDFSVWTPFQMPNRYVRKIYASYCLACLTTFFSVLGAGGGLACIQHFRLRIILTCHHKIPWNLARFLTYCHDRRLLQQIGGRYRFIHRELLDHFAAMEK
jgi:hypothetical protein